MFHLAAFWQSVNPAGAYVQLAAPADQELSVNTPKILVPVLNNVILVAAGLESTAVPRARLVSPSILSVFRNQISPVSFAAAAGVVPLSPARLMDMRNDPLILIPQEQLTAEINSNPLAAQAQWVLVWFADKPPTPVQGKVYTARATVANPLAAGVWTVNTLTFDDALPRGRYQVVGFKAVSTTMIASRILIPNVPWRPGCLGNQLVSDVESPIFRFGNLGEWGQFEDTTNLQIESLANAADTAASQIYFVDLIQLRPGPG